MTSIDTNVVLRFLLNDVPDQSARARRLIATSSVYVSDVVITEAVYVLEQSLEFDRGFIAATIRAFLAVNGVSHNDHILTEAISLFERRPKLSFVDCYAVVEAKVFGANLYSFDRKLRNQGGSHVVEP